jgi:lipoyl(octanoyl) transferase
LRVSEAHASSPARRPLAPAIIDLGRLDYHQAYTIQQDHLEEVLAARDAGQPEIGRVLLVEHPPVITIGRHPGSASHLLVSAMTLASHGVALAETDRGGDITYHGPGQLVVYPIIDLNRLNLGLHAYMRLLEQAVIDSCARWGILAQREPGATGVWVHDPASTQAQDAAPAKLAAMGVRVRRWVSMHGLAINVDPDLTHFDLIVPCGLAGRRVTSLRSLLGPKAPSFDDVKRTLVEELSAHLVRAAQNAELARATQPS